MTGVASHRNPVMCANSMMGSWILWRYIPKEKGGWGGRFPSRYDREALFNKPLICKQEKNDLKVGSTESEAREDIRRAMDAILGRRLVMQPKDIPSEWHERNRHRQAGSGRGEAQTRTHSRTHARTHSRTHTHTHTYTHTHTHTQEVRYTRAHMHIPSEWHEHIRHGGRVSGVGIMCEAGRHFQ
jgi:hypothetical protein